MKKTTRQKNLTLSAEEEHHFFSVIAQGKRAELLLDREPLSEDIKKNLYAVIEQAEAAKKTIFHAYLKLIDNVQFSYCYNPLYLLEDVKQDAAIKLMDCITNYVPERGSFQSYANKCIKGCVLDTLATNTNLIIQKKGFVKQVWKVEHFISDWHKINGTFPSEQEIIDNLPINRQALSNVFRYNKQVYSYNAGVGIDDGSPAQSEETISKDVYDSEYACDDQRLVNTTETLEEGTMLYQQVKAQLSDILDEYCTEKERMILNYRFGFHTKPMAAAEIADMTNMDINEVELTWARVLFKLEAPCREKGLNLIL